MNFTVQSLFDQAQQLAVHERAELAGMLLHSLDKESEEFTSAELETAWEEELLRRDQEMESGAVQGNNPFDAVERIRRSFPQ